MGSPSAPIGTPPRRRLLFRHKELPALVQGAQFGADSHQLRADVVRAQPQETGDARLHAGEPGPVTTAAGRDLPRRIAAADQSLAVVHDLLADVGGGPW